MSGKAKPEPVSEPFGLTGQSALAANLVGLAPLLFAAVLHSTNRQLYYLSAQEDGVLEWATFWSLAGAGAIFLFAAVRQFRRGASFPWFLCGVALFCIFVAGEEISWGQRVLGYRPPAYFLEENFQQELNIHNVWDTDLRKLLAKATLLAYGVFLPLAALAPPLRRLFSRLAVVNPPAALIPVFLGAFLVYQSYPWKFSGEIIEAVMGFGFLFAAMAAVGAVRGGRFEGAPRLVEVLVGTAVVLVLSVATFGLSGLGLWSNPEAVTAARTELEAMGRDFMRGGGPISRCHVHKRVYSWVEKYDVEPLRRGAFSRLSADGLPEDRAEFFIDPWNSPYWIRHRCKDSSRKQRLFIYSFGPDRRRQSSEWEIAGDDVGIVLYEQGF